MEWMLLPLKRYADFSGRSRRKEYWMFVLFYMLVLIGLLGLFFAGTDVAEGTGEPAMGGLSSVAMGLLGLFVLGTFIPNIAVQVRRFHDQDKSGWMVLLGFVPYIGGLVLLVFMCLEGPRGPNRYGPDPKDPGQADVFN